MGKIVVEFRPDEQVEVRLLKITPPLGPVLISRRKLGLDRDKAGLLLGPQCSLRTRWWPGRSWSRTSTLVRWPRSAHPDPPLALCWS